MNLAVSILQLVAASIALATAVLDLVKACLKGDGRKKRR